MKSTTLNQHLQERGIFCRSLTRSQRDGDVYVASFSPPEMVGCTEPARVWAWRLFFALNVEIIKLHEVVADWRIGKPVIIASVTFQLKKNPAQGEVVKIAASRAMQHIV